MSKVNVWLATPHSGHVQNGRITIDTMNVHPKYLFCVENQFLKEFFLLSYIWNLLQNEMEFYIGTTEEWKLCDFV